MKLGISAAMIAAIITATTACSATGSAKPTSTPTPTPDANAVACQKFEEVSNTLSEVIKNDQIKQPWEDLRNQFDEVGLRAEGDVKARIETLVEEWPDFSEILIYRKFDSYNEPVQAVARACEAAGTPINPDQFQAQG